MQTADFSAGALRRPIFHLVLAYFMADASMKFFFTSLDSVVGRDFFFRIFEWRGDAPDQYRVLPFLLLKYAWVGWQALVPTPSWEKSVVVFGTIFGYLVFEGFYALNRAWPGRRRLAFNVVFAVLYIYWLFQGWRPEVPALLAVCLANVLLWQRGAAPGWCWVAIVALAFCRTDIALVYAVFYGAWARLPTFHRALLALMPVAVQLWLQYGLFPDAEYYCEKIMFWQNVRLGFIRYSPATWLLLAGCIVFWAELKAVGQTIRRSFPLLLWLMAGYFLLTLVVARVNEYRIYLPFVPLVLLVLADEKRVTKASQTSGATAT